MFRQTLFFPFLVAAIVAPFLLVSDGTDSDSDTDAEVSPAVDVESLTEPGEIQQFYAPAGNLGDIFNFGLTPDAVRSRWNQVTESELQGLTILRSSILSGHGPNDIGGAITYRFNSRNQMQGIQFIGFATNPNALIQFATSQFGLQAELGNKNQFVSGNFSRYDGTLKVQSSSQFKGQFKVELDLMLR